MEKISKNPAKMVVVGNIIGNEYGFLESFKNFSAYKCKILRMPDDGEKISYFQRYGLQLKYTPGIENKFPERLAECSERGLSDIYYCSNLDAVTTFNDSDFTPLQEIAEGVAYFDLGYTFYLNSEFDTPEDSTSVKAILLAPITDGEPQIPGVKIDTNKDIYFSFNFDASDSWEFLKIGFIFLDLNGNLLGESAPYDIGNVATGNSGREHVICRADDIPDDAVTALVEIQIPNTVLEGDYISISKNTFLQDTYIEDEGYANIDSEEDYFIIPDNNINTKLSLPLFLNDVSNLNICDRVGVRVILKDVDNNPLADKPIRFFADGSYFTELVTNHEGVAELSTINGFVITRTGTIPVAAYFVGDEEYNSSISYEEITVAEEENLDG